MGIGDRLREERERLKLNQEQLGAAGGVRKQAQLHYEKGERHPDSKYLEAVSGVGVDVLYVLTGQPQAERGQGVPSAPGPATEEPGPMTFQLGVNVDEKELLLDYRKCSDTGQAVLRQMAKELAK